MCEDDGMISSKSLDHYLGVLWGKSDAGGRPNLLLQHLLDAGAVGELIWDHFLASATKTRLNDISSGHGRSLLVLLCAIHDVGKATPAFQSKDAVLGRRVSESGLVLQKLSRSDRNWHHTLAGAVIAQRVFKVKGWSSENIKWLWPLVAGHHGLVLGEGRLGNQRPAAQGDQTWVAVQDELVRRVVVYLKVEIGELAHGPIPRLALQLQLAGLVVMADWIASNAEHFPGIDHLESVSMAGARARAIAAWDRIGLVGGWSPSQLSRGVTTLSVRFGIDPRPVQVAAVELAETIPVPGLILIEAPTGEGKTEGALAATESLARRFGADGVFVGMPTQATSDPMWRRVTSWAQAIDPEIPIGLLHGRRQFNRDWRNLLNENHFGGIDEDEFGCENAYGTTSHVGGVRTQSGAAPAEWFLGRKRGLLIPLTVGTVDNLLHAATRTKHVMLRQAALGGRVVVLDEVHSYDVYTSQFLFEILRWLGDARVPVILLSATLSPKLRRCLLSAYLQGATGSVRPDIVNLPGEVGYPSVMGAWPTNTGGHVSATSVPAWRPARRLEVTVLPGADDDDPARVVGYLAEALSGGGCALVVRNTVGRAQDTFRAAKERFGGDVVLLHSRLTAIERAVRTERVLELLGPSTGAAPPRPRRLVVIATQVAEQSFDIDADLVISDLAPVDLLLQRVGRLHRHERSAAARPVKLRVPRVVVTGIEWREGEGPSFPAGSTYVYGDHLLLRAAALVREAAAQGGWTLPDDIPSLVSRGYGSDPLGPGDWTTAEVAAQVTWDAREARRRELAAQYVLLGDDHLGRSTLAGLHERANSELDEDEADGAVRDGPETVEVVLVRKDERGYRTVSGRWLGCTGEVAASLNEDDVLLEEVLGSTVRLPPGEELTRAARSLCPLPSWASHPWLARSRALAFEPSGEVILGERRLSYDDELGLIVEHARR